MSKKKVWFVGLLLVLMAIVSLGIFKPTATITSSFTVRRSAATAFRVLTTSSTIPMLVDKVSTVEPLVEHDQQIGNRYRVLEGDVEPPNEYEIELTGFLEMEQVAYTFSRPHVQTVVSYELLRTATGTTIEVSRQIIPLSWWRRSFLMILQDSEAKAQIRINDELKRLIETSPESLIGDWISSGPDGQEQMFSFRSDEKADWRVAIGAAVYPITDLVWKRESSVQPELLDLSGFTAGPLRGLTLFGIIDMSRLDTLIFDAEAGLPDDDRVRPMAFTESAVTYVRIR
ncbi:MAG: hypothetical protein O3B41_01565 [Bacteroidetes bacterium]|nr:hypothetical protein [Bacteroidota bacterium]